jgi:hypothetical protein
MASLVHQNGQAGRMGRLAEWAGWNDSLLPDPALNRRAKENADFL